MKGTSRSHPGVLVGGFLVLFFASAMLHGSTLEVPPLSSGAAPRMARIDSLTAVQDYDAAHALIVEEIPWARAVGDSLYLTVLLLRQGNMWGAFGLAEQAKPPLTEAMALCEARADTFYAFQCLRWLGVTSFHLGRNEEARGFFDEMLTRALATGNGQKEGGALIGLAYYDQICGNPSGSADRYRRAISLFNKWGTPESENFALNGLGTALHDLGEFDEALECYYRAAEIARQQGGGYVLALAENNIGVLLFSLGDPGEALRHFEQAVAIQKADGAHRAYILPTANIALCELELGRDREATERLNGLLVECEAGGYEDLKYEVLSNLALSRAKADQHGLAEETYRRLLAEVARAQHDVVLHALTGAIYAMREQGKLEQAHALYLEFEDWSEQLQDPSQKLELDLEIGLLLNDLGRLEEGADRLSRAVASSAELGLSHFHLMSLTALATLRQRQDRDEDALELLIEATEIWEADRLVPLDPEWREQRGTWSRRICSDLATLQWRLGIEVSAAERSATVFNTVQTFKARTLLERLGGPGNRWQRLQDAGSAPSLTEFQNEVLQDDELFLDFLLGRSHSLLLAITRDELRLVALPAEEKLNDRLRIFRDLLATPPTGSSSETDFLTTSAARLREQLLGEVDDLVADAASLIISPDGMLNMIPFSLLLKERPSVPGPRQWQQVPSAAFLAELRSRQPGAAARPSRILALAGPSQAGGTALTGAQAEVAHLARRYRDVTRLLPDIAADPDSLGAGLADFQILHFATHSTADDQAPWNSAISLAAPDTSGVSLELAARRIADLSLPARLVVLSSCQSVAGRALSGEGLQGLASAFLSAGAPAVVASLWPVDDMATALLMESFYDELSSGATTARALTAARREVAEVPATSHPFFWAGFVVIGAGEEVINLQQEPRARLGLVIGCAALILAAALLLWRPKRGNSNS